jgi:predicted secreted protein
MATVTGWLGKGTKLQRNSGGTQGTPTYVEIANLTSISGPSATTDQIDITSHNTASSFREMMTGMTDGGEVNASVNYDPGQTTLASGWGAASNAHNRLMQDLEDGSEYTYRVVFPDTGSSTVEFPGVVSSVSLSHPVDGVHTMDFTVKIVGDITWPS